MKGQPGTNLKGHSNVDLPVRLAEVSTEPTTQLNFSFCPICLLPHPFPALGTKSTP